MNTNIESPPEFVAFESVLKTVAAVLGDSAFLPATHDVIEQADRKIRNIFLSNANLNNVILASNGLRVTGGKCRPGIAGIEIAWDTEFYPKARHKFFSVVFKPLGYYKEFDLWLKLVDTVPVSLIVRSSDNERSVFFTKDSLGILRMHGYAIDSSEMIEAHKRARLIEPSLL